MMHFSTPKAFTVPHLVIPRPGPQAFHQLNPVLWNSYSEVLLSLPKAEVWAYRLTGTD